MSNFTITKIERDNYERTTTRIYEFDDGDVYRYHYNYHGNTSIVNTETLFVNNRFHERVCFDEKGRMIMIEFEDFYQIFIYEDDYDEINEAHVFTYSDDILIEECHYGVEIKVA